MPSVITPLYKSLTELNEETNKIVESYSGEPLIDCLNHAISHLEKYNLEVNGRAATIDYDRAYVNFMVTTSIITTLVAKKKDYKEFMANKKKREIYDGLARKIYQDKKIDLIKERIKQRVSTSSHIRSTSTSSDDLLERFERLRVPKAIEKTTVGNVPNPEPQIVTTPSHDGPEQKSRPGRSTDNLKAPTNSNSTTLTPPLRLNYRSRSPSPARIADIEVDNTVDPRVFDRYNNRWYLSCDELVGLIKNTPKSILLLDIRNRKEFDKSHIQSDNILCIEPFSIHSNFTEKELQDSLLISPQFEQHLFEHRNIFELVIFYDYGYSVSEGFDATFQNLPKYFKKLLSTINARSPGVPLKRNPLILSGGFSGWYTKFGKEFVTQPRVEKLIQPESIPSRPLSFRKTSLSSIGSSPFEPSLMSHHSIDNYGGSNSPHHTGGSNILTDSTPYAKNLQEFYSSSSLDISSPQISNNGPQFFPQQQPPAYSKRLSYNGKINGDSSGVTIDKKNSFSSSFSSLIKSPSVGSPTLPSKTPLVRQPLSPLIDQSPLPFNGLRAPEPVAFSPSASPATTPFFNSYNTNIPNGSQSEPSNNSQDSVKPITVPLDFTSGLYNLGNSCYMNCVLQCLTGTTQLSIIFLNNSYKRYINVNSKLGSKGVLANNFYEVVKLMSKTDGSYIIPSKFKNICGSLNNEFKGSEQQDCQEFLNFLLDGLHEDLNQCGGHPPMKTLTEQDEVRREKLPFRIASTIEWERYLKTDFSAVVDLFQGQYLSRLQCLRCGRTSTTYQAFSTLSLPIPDTKGKPSVSIEDCFDEFTKLELLDGDNKWHCPQCKSPQKASKVLKITRLPKILILHFKRFKAGFGWEKLETFIKYPVTQELKLEKYWTPISSEEERRRLGQLQSRGQVPPFNYKVYGVVNHFGNIRGGHYTSYVYKGPKKGWCYYDDTKVYKNQKPSAVCTKDNYVLFLQRV